MPDVNLIKNTKDVEEPEHKPAPQGFNVTSPGQEPRPGLGGFVRSLFNRREAPIGSTPTRPLGSSSMSLNKNKPAERILSETKKTQAAVIPLPEDDGEYNVNLLTEDVVTTFNPRQKMIQLGLIAAGSILVIAAAYGGLIVYQGKVSQDITSRETELHNLQSEVVSLNGQQQEIVATTKKIAAIHGLIDRHIYWTTFFRQLEHYTIPTVTFGPTFSSDIAGSLTLTATTDSFDSVAKQYLVLEQAVVNHDFISQFLITGAAHQTAATGDKVTFTVSLSLLPSVLQNATSASTRSANQP